MQMEHESDGNEALMAEPERKQLEASVADEQKMEQLEALVAELRTENAELAAEKEETALSQPVSLYIVDLEDYRCNLATRMTQAWGIAKEKINSAQQAQNIQFDKTAKVPKLSNGDRVMVYMPTRSSRQSEKVG